MAEETKNTNGNDMSLKDEVCDWINTMLGAFFVVIIIFTFVGRQVRVEGSSMVPTLHDTDRLVVSNFYGDVTNGDIVVCVNDALEKRIVKRVIATEGQEVNIDFQKGLVYVDGKQLTEPYVNSLTNRDLGGFKSYPVTIPKDCYFVMGDNRNDSTDSRDSRVGFVNKKDIMGKAYFRIYPFKNFGKIK